MPVVEVKNIYKSYIMQNGYRLNVLDNVSFKAEDGEFCCLLGTSGCGKSTILNIIAGLVSADSGEIKVGKYNPGNPKTRIGYVFQKSRLLNWRTVRENLYFALKAMDIPKDEWDWRIKHYIELVKLVHFENEYPLSLSGGMQQRVAIARALAIEPDVLLMDEPFSNLDELTARTLRKELLRIWREEKKTIIFVTHNALEAVYLADKIFLFSSRPASIIESITVDVPREREMEDPRLIKIQKEIVGILESN